MSDHIEAVERRTDHTDAAQADVARGWQRILAGAETLADLEPDLSGRVEELIDFVTGDSLDR